MTSASEPHNVLDWFLPGQRGEGLPQIHGEAARAVEVHETRHGGRRRVVGAEQTQMNGVRGLCDGAKSTIRHT